MYIPWNWLKKHISFSASIQSQETAKRLTSLGLETEVIGEIWQFTPLPNRLDLFSWWGIAQEISILLDYPLNLPLARQQKINQTSQEANWGKIVVNTLHCSWIQLSLVQKVKIEKSPQWLKHCLSSNNIISINNVIDIANLVMLETGQPIHIYDYDKLSSKEINVRQAVEKETIITLSKKESVLNSEDILISSGNEIISLAGVIGSRATAVNEQTTNILIENAFFTPCSIKKTSQHLAISTQASQNFSKKLNLPFGNYALTRAIELIKEICQGEKKEQIIYWSKEKVQQREKIITIRQEFIEKKLGTKLDSKKLEEILKKLHFIYQKNK